MNDVRDTFRRRVWSAAQGRLLGGVCAGLADGSASTVAGTLLFVVVLLVLPGKPVHRLPDPWILMPDEAAVREPRPGAADRAGPPA